MKRVRINGHWFGAFWCDVYHCNFDIIWPVNGRLVSKFMRENYGLRRPVDDDFGAECFEVKPKTGGYGNLICMRSWHGKHGDIANLAHEVFHAVDHTLRSRDIKPRRWNSEPYAYMIESVMGRYLDLLDTRRKVT